VHPGSSPSRASRPSPAGTTAFAPTASPVRRPTSSSE
jgi:hypothetical protein